MKKFFALVSVLGFVLSVQAQAEDPLSRYAALKKLFENGMTPDFQGGVDQVKSGRCFSPKNKPLASFVWIISEPRYPADAGPLFEDRGVQYKLNTAIWDSLESNAFDSMTEEDLLKKNSTFRDLSSVDEKTQGMRFDSDYKVRLRKSEQYLLARWDYRSNEGEFYCYYWQRGSRP